MDDLSSPSEDPTTVLGVDLSLEYFFSLYSVSTLAVYVNGISSR